MFINASPYGRSPYVAASGAQQCKPKHGDLLAGRRNALYCRDGCGPITSGTEVQIIISGHLMPRGNDKTEVRVKTSVLFR